jgi:hypothetical protein
MERGNTPSRDGLATVELGAGVVGHGLLSVELDGVSGLRKRPGPVPSGWGRVPPSLLRYSDEQTVVATAAVFTAIEAMAADPARFQDWGVVAVSRFLGRANLAVALAQFRAEGVWGTSPHLIPHFALHSPSGTISLALGAHGPNVGVGGGMRGEAEGFLTAFTWLASGAAPGVWLVLSGWSPELVPDAGGGAPRAGPCVALAMALVPVSAEADVSARGDRVFRAVTTSDHLSVTGPVELAQLAARLESSDLTGSAVIAGDPKCGLQIELLSRSDETG